MRRGADLVQHLDCSAAGAFVLVPQHLRQVLARGGEVGQRQLPGERGVEAGHLKPRGEVSRSQEKWLGPLIGAVAGAMAGVSSLTGPLLITYLLALRLPRDVFVGSISIIYLLGSIPMYTAMWMWGRFGLDALAWSYAGLVPMYLGLKIGAQIRHRLSEESFRRVLLGFLIFLAILLVLK